MRQIVQNLGSGDTVLADVPIPAQKAGSTIIESRLSLISSGTERMLVEFGKASLIEKARSQPERVVEVLKKVKTDGVMTTLDAVRSKLDEPIPLGYCNVGVVRGDANSSLPAGTRVVSNGPHAEVVRVPNRLIAEVPDNVQDETAVFTVLAAIAMQGIRLINPTLGEAVAVTGLGVIGLLAVQILKANGCRVLATDPDPIKCNIAESYGAEAMVARDEQDLLARADAFSRGRGMDAVLIAASSASNQIIHQSALICRKKARIVLIGVVGLDLSRADFYEKELTFQVSCSYGPGRYDDSYEQDGLDYPFAYVRWTEQRNFEAVLDLMSSGQIDVGALISARVSITESLDAYESLSDSGTLGVLIDYSQCATPISQSRISIGGDLRSAPSRQGSKISFLGAGNYASRVLIPAFVNADAELTTLVTSGGLGSAHYGRKFRFKFAATDIADAINDDSDAIVIATRHNSHAEQVVSALDSRKHVFVEKPLAINMSELQEIENSYAASDSILMVGFNRRFSPLTQELKNFLTKRSKPCFISILVNAGAVPKDHWTQSTSVGGGRIIGEACHFIDLARYLVGNEIASHSSMFVDNKPENGNPRDSAVIDVGFSDGSVASIKYLSNGSKSFKKERIEVFCDGAVVQIDNFRSIKAFGTNLIRPRRLLSQNKGQNECAAAFMKAIQNGSRAPISIEEVFEVARTAIEVAENA